ncbi:MAG: hypothetical protein KKE62_01880 [Proteobacteria bacterium]|nr:hypothetical protein [Pseudomonadota bacterium]MBU1387112.1 hypothetical protein [Pseudomonadota bacterium]MBU1541571.1 hypothetical protein [Pseudomonadota bacterium]MBU2482759.1 hypothetical protein [Pseudomonadota bacterium]
MQRTPANICCTSIDDARSSFYHTDDLELLKNAIRYELKHGNRKGMIKILKSKIRQLENSQRSHGQ